MPEEIRSQVSLSDYYRFYAPVKCSWDHFSVLYYYADHIQHTTQIWCRKAHLAASSRKVEPCPPLLSKLRVPRLETDKPLHLYHPWGSYLVHTALRIDRGRRKFFFLVGANLMLRLGQYVVQP